MLPELAQSDSEPAKDFAATLRYAATIATVEVLRRLVRDLRTWVEHDGVSIAHGTREPDAWQQLANLDVRIDAVGCAEREQTAVQP